MKMAMKNGKILIREADSVQFAIIKSWGKMKWSRQRQELSGPADIELLNKLAGIVKLLAEKIGMECDGASLGIAIADEVSGGLTMNLGVVQ